MQARAETVLPRFIAPPAPLCLWLLLGCLLAASVLAWFARVPVYRNGIATVKDVQVIAFFPPESRTEIKTGQRLSLKLDPNGPPLVQAITNIEPEILSPANARAKFQLANTIHQRPATIAIAHLEGVNASVYDGSVVEARLEVGSQRLIALLPGVGSFFR